MELVAVPEQRVVGDRRPGLTRVVLLCTIAVAFGFAIRLPWIQWASTNDSMQWQGTVQATTYDALYHGAAIRRHVEGRLDGVDDVSGLISNHSLVQWPGMAARWLLPISTDTVLLWTPVVLAGFLAIPIILIGRCLGNVWWGFGSSIIALAAVNYYERTMGGYYDHDMLSLTWVTMIAWLLIEADRRSSMAWTFAGCMSMVLLPLLYAAGSIIAIGVGVVWIVQRLVRDHRSPFTRSSTILVALASAAVPFAAGDRVAIDPWPWFGLAALLLVAAILLRRAPSMRFYVVLVGCSLVLAAVVFPWNETWIKVVTYAKGVDLGSLATGRFAEISYREPHRLSIMEGQRVSLDELGYRLLGNVWLSLLAIAGYFIACLCRPLLLCLLPMTAVGLFAFTGGLRFITWATVPAAIGVAWIAFLVPSLLRARSASSPHTGALTVAVGIVLCILMATPGILHTIRFKPPSSFNTSEIEVLQVLDDVSDSVDVTIGWWDYGSGIWYYGGCDVLVHPGRRSDDLFFISHLLLGDSQTQAAGLARALSGWRSAGARVPTRTALQKAGYPAKRDLGEAMGRVESEKDPAPDHSDRTFLYLPFNQLTLLETIANFRHDDAVGRDRRNPFVRVLQGLSLQDNRYLYYPGNGLVFDRVTGATGVTGEDGRVTPVSFTSVLLVEHDDSTASTRTTMVPDTSTDRWATIDRAAGGLSIESTPPDVDRQVHLLIVPDQDAMVLLDRHAFASNAVRMGVLGAYDPDLFRPVHATSAARLYEVLPKVDPK